MKKILFTLLAVATFGAASAQSWGYAREGHWAADVAADADGNVFATGYSWNDPDFLTYNDNYVIKLDADGNELWVNDGLDIPFDYFTSTNVFPDGAGGCTVVGYSNFATAAAYGLDAGGNLTWDSEAWTSTSNNNLLYQGASAKLSDGRIVIGGFNEDYFYRFSVVGTDGSLLSEFEIEADTTGWAFSYFSYRETGLCATADGGFAFSAGGEGFFNLMKFDSDLNLDWSADYDQDPDTWEYGNYNNCLSQTSDGGYLLAASGSGGAFGTYMGSVRKMDAAGNLEWTTYLNHGADWEEGSHAMQVGDYYYAWTQDAGDNSSHAWVLDAGGAEIDSVFIPVINCTWGFGETGMEIWAIRPAADGGYYISGRQYVEDCDQRFTVIKSEADGSFGPCIFNCVWPGDANNDGYADADDLFEIGINYGAEGFTRDDDAIDWSAKLARAWMEEDTLYWYVLNDLKYTDCDGNGIINDDDTTAVISNFGLDHPLNTTRTSAEGVPLYFDPSVTTLEVGMNHIPILLGDAIDPVDAIYGIAFTVTTSSSSVDGASLKIRFGDSWMAGADEQLSLSVNSAEEKKAASAMVRTARTNTEGQGEIATLDVVVIDNLAGKLETEDITLHIVDAKAIMLDRSEIPVDAQSASFTADISEPSSLNDLEAGGISIYPNPVAAGQQPVVNGSGIEQIEILDLTGKQVASIRQEPWPVLPAGTYTIRVTNQSGVYTGQLVIL